MSIFEFTDYRTFLKAWIKALPKYGRGEVNRIAKHLRVNPTLISQTLSGLREFTPEQAFELAAYMGLAELESEYFSLLVQIERAGTHTFKKHLQTKLQKLKDDSRAMVKRVKRDRELSEYEKSVFYSSPLYSAIRLFCSTGEGQSLESVCARFQIPRAKAQGVLKFLVETLLCVEGEGVYRMGPNVTHLEHSSEFIWRHHTNWRLKSLQRAESLSEEELMFSAPLSISRKDFARVRERLVGLIKDVAVDVRATEPEDVACLNLDFFWVQK